MNMKILIKLIDIIIEFFSDMNSLANSNELKTYIVEISIIKVSRY